MHKTMRIVVPDSLWRRYKIICTKLDLSSSKQICSLIQNFVDAQEETEKMMKK